MDIEERKQDKENEIENIVSYNENSDGHFSELHEHVRKKLTMPEHRRIKIGLNMLIRSLFLIQNAWKATKRELLLIELTNNMHRQYEIEIEVEKINDFILREYIYDQLDNISSVRRSISEEIKWDIESNKNSKISK